jgi:hippurate hydrolase
MPVGAFGIRPGPIMASTDHVKIHIKGVGGHAAAPHKGIDPIVVGAQLVTALQSIVSRGVDPVESVVVSICQFHAGNAFNIIPQTAELAGTVRALKSEMRSFVEKRMREIVAGVAQATGATITLDYERGYPVTVNHPEQTETAIRIAREVAGRDNVLVEIPPVMGAEDFSYMLEARPGAFIFVGNGDSAGLHHPAYNFNDEAILYGTSYWIRLAETTLAA